jgi:hypothetical protein
MDGGVRKINVICTARLFSIGFLVAMLVAWPAPTQSAPDAGVASPPDGGAPDGAGVPDGTDAAPRAPSPAETALPAAHAAALFGIESDPVPAELAAGVHFPTSNEIRPYLWREVIQDLGGIYVGVGTDQNYVMAGWAKPDLLILMDFDQLVVDLHLIYRAAFVAASNPKDFMALWSKKNAKTFQALLALTIPDPELRKTMVEDFKAWRRPIEIRLDNLRRWHQEQKIKTFLDDPEQYAYLSGLFRNNRVLAIRGDLTATRTMRGIGQLAKVVNLLIRVLYLSNAERYFPYSQDYKDNILALPFDERSIVLRTTGLGSWANGDPFYYVYQSGLNFLEWIKAPQIMQVATMIRYRTAQKQKYLYSIDKLPPPPPEHKKTKAVEKKPAAKAKNKAKNKGEAPTKKPVDPGPAPAGGDNGKQVRLEGAAGRPG